MSQKWKFDVSILDVIPYAEWLAAKRPAALPATSPFVSLLWPRPLIQGRHLQRKTIEPICIEYMQKIAQWLVNSSLHASPFSPLMGLYA